MLLIFFAEDKISIIVLFPTTLTRHVLQWHVIALIRLRIILNILLKTFKVKPLNANIWPGLWVVISRRFTMDGGQIWAHPITLLIGDPIR